jgi:hypothetical protein
VTELAQSGGVVLEQGEALEWVDLAGGEWVAPGQAQVRQENVCVQDAERRLPTESEFPVTLRIALSAGQEW